MSTTDQSTVKVSTDNAPRETLGQTLGRYKLLEQIGEGGFGVVYVAEQKEPVKRRVALKIIKLGMDTRQVVARFEAERQALALMDHPNIAKVLDAGATESGRPYFVMELVRGVRITDYSDQEKLSTRNRLELFIKVCQAIQHAHQKGIIHRDIKPSNILVTLHDGIPMPKVIDFGIAKATQQELTEKTVYTQLQQFIGTPAYMSPEQAEMSGLDIDTRSDIYSLGVLLYELLTGSTPFDTQELVRSGLDQMRKIIREREPVRPSTRLRQTSSVNLSAPQRSSLNAQLSTDLDWIVMKCLEKDRSRRYDTANGVAMDLQRHLNNEPVVARPPSSAYRFQKLVGRNKAAFAAAGAVVVALLLGAIGSTWQAVQATRAKNEALAAKGREALQREKAETNEKKALEATASEAKLRQRAQAEELSARQRAYASDMIVAQQAFEGNNHGRALELLDRQRPQPNQKDLRGWEWRYLWQQTRSDALFTLGKIKGVLYCLAASANGRWLVAGSYHQGGIEVWDLQTHRQIAHLSENERHHRAAFSPVDPLLAFTGAESTPATILTPSSGTFTQEQSKFTLHLWNVATGQMIAEVPLDADCMGVSFSHDGQLLMTSTVNGHITLWRMPGLTKLASYSCEQAGTEGGAQFATTPDGSYAAYALRDGRIRLIDLHDGKERWTTVASKEFILSVAFSPDGRTLATGAGYGDSQLRLWDTATGAEIGHLDGHTSWISSIVFWPDGKKLATSSADQTVRIWDVATGKCLDVLRGHDTEVWRLVLLPDNQTLVSGGKDGIICFWDASVTHGRTSRITIPQRVLGFCFAPDARSLTTLDTEGRITRWSGPGFGEKQILLRIASTEDFSHSLGDYVEAEGRHFLFSTDTRFLAVTMPADILQVWDLSNRRLRCQLTNSGGALWPKAFFSQGNNLLAWSAKDNSLQQWDLNIQRLTDLWKAPALFVGTALSADEQLCLAFGYEGESTIRDLTNKSQTSSNSLSLEITEAAFSPDGSLLAVASELGSAQVFSTATWKARATLGGFLLSTHAVGFSPDGKRLGVSGDDKEAVKLWETESWQQVLTLQGEGSLFHAVAFSADGNKLAALNSHGVLHLWTAPGWEEISAEEATEKARVNQ